MEMGLYALEAGPVFQYALTDVVKPKFVCPPEQLRNADPEHSSVQQIAQMLGEFLFRASLQDVYACARSYDTYIIRPRTKVNDMQ